MTRLWRSATVSVVIAAGVALVVCFWSYRGARAEAVVADQAGWLALSVTAAVISGLGNGWFLLARRRAIAVRRNQLLGTDRPAWTGPPEVAATALVSGRGMTRYHRPGCSLVAGKSVGAVGRDAHERAGRRPCDWCRP